MRETTSLSPPRTTPATRARRDVVLWVAWSALVVITVALSVWALRVLLDAPHDLTPWVFLGLVTVPVAGVAASVRGLRWLAAPVLGVTIVASGLVLMVLGVYLVVVVGLGDEINGTEHRLLGLSMVAALVAVLLAGPVRSRLREMTARWAGHERRRATTALETFGARMTRAVPMDELLLQLAETLRSTIGPLGAEVWTGEKGVLERTVSVPERGRARIELVGPELAAVTGARVSGNAWAAMWLPTVLADLNGAEEPQVRIASVTHLGRLLGLLVVLRSAEDHPFSEDHDRVLTDLARQVGLALHNVSLDSALQESLEMLRQRNIELQASRARIVSTADASRRQIERNLHDGAQQHLVALAVRLGLARRLAADDPASLEPTLEELRQEVQATLTELRDLAHGIYPPLLRDHGLGEALDNAAGRVTLPTSVKVSTQRRFDADIETAVYFCCLEAMQNADKHAGEDAEVTIRVFEEEGTLVFEVGDDGLGFDPETARDSHGFVNMADRVGAFGGEVVVDSAPGRGTIVRGELPVEGPEDGELL